MKRSKSGYIGMIMALGLTITFLLSHNAQTQDSVSAAANGSTMVYLPVAMNGFQFPTTGQTQRVSVASDGTQGNAGSWSVDIQPMAAM
jgi:hypothetical protein